MATFFIGIYHFFQKRNILLFSIVVILFVVLGYFAAKLRYEEDITRFIPHTADSKNINAVFRHLKIKDKIVILFSSKTEDTGEITETGEAFSVALDSLYGKNYIKQITSRIDAQKMLTVSCFIYSNLPVFLDSTDYARMDTMLQPQSVDRQLQANYNNLLSPSGMFTKDFIFRDPLGLGNKAFERLRSLQVSGDYNITDEHIFSKDGKTMLVYIEPAYPAGNTVENSVLIDGIENLIGEFSKKEPQINIEYFGAPAVAVYNARQIRQDTTVTLSIAFLIIAAVILLSFRNKLSLLLIFLPVAFGGIFALAMLYFLKGELSLIAVGAGSVIFGVVLSYSIHVIAHREHTPNVEQIIREMAEPLTIGSITTIGAFFSLVFTSSEVLQDFGWFASFTIIGTTFFCLIFLPHFLSTKQKNEERPNRFLKIIEKINGYSYEKNKWLVGAIIVISIAGFYFAGNVSFNSDMNSLSFQPEKLKKTEEKLDHIFQKEYKNIYFIAVGDTEDAALTNYRQMNQKLDEIKKAGLIHGYATGESLLIPVEEQQKRIEKWNSFWTSGRKTKLRNEITRLGKTYLFKEESFNPFWEMLEKRYNPITYNDENKAADVFSDWITNEADVSMAISQIQLKEGEKESVYSQFSSQKGVVILDKPYFSSSFVNYIVEDFHFVLLVSSLIVFLALLLSYGRFELALITFTPMMLSWFIILGLMALFGIEFNIVNIIISTFIFGIGDDFSVFITDGLSSEYRNGKKLFAAHKTAIFFSAFTTIVGMGALAFARHPALKSVSFISITGMLAVLLIAYAIQPLLFRLLITGRKQKRLFPWSFISLFFTIWLVGTFTICSMLLSLLGLILFVFPMKKEKKRLILHYLMMYGCRLIQFMGFNVKKIVKNEHKENFINPAIIIANHQSVIDILRILSLSPKIVMLTNKWVWESPVFGKLVQAAGFYYAGEGYENSLEPLKKMVDEGYSVAIFPEGTRSKDGRLNRFHKGAFYIAEQLNLDILPVIMTGNNLSIEKNDVLYVKRATISLEILERIKAGDCSWGESYRERRKSIVKFFKERYEKALLASENVDNLFYFYKLTRNYIYKGPVLEWYMRAKVKMERNYRVFDELIPRSATITDIGCGYGFLAYMLAFVSDKRTITGIDYDGEKIEVANNCFSRTGKINFIAANAVTCQLAESDVFVLNDMLHYLPFDMQEKLVENCMKAINPNGMIIIRDGDSAKKEKHGVTKLTEIFSTKILRFNKTEGKLFFTSFEKIKSIADKNGFCVETLENDRFTSNTIFVLRRNS
jgi:1-acyl-sn-glycerol-3-phosphate acyltransferase